MSIADEHSGTRLLHDAYNSAFSSPEPSKTQKGLDRFGERFMKARSSSLVEFADSFTEANRDTISSAVNAISSLDIGQIPIKDAITGFAEQAAVVMKGLEALGQIHPFIGVAVVAFKLVVTLDLTRRENNKKVLAIKLEMQKMMCVLFQLRRMKDPDEVGPDGMTIKDRMQGLMQEIANDIKACGSACDVYMKKSFLVKTIKSMNYEHKLASYAALFDGRKEELKFALSVHTALGVDSANEKLDKQAVQLDSIEKNMMMIFRQLDTPREKEVMQFVQDNGGAKACVDKDDLLKQLVAKSGESMSSVSARGNANKGEELASARKSLLKEIAEDLDQALNRNLELFEGKLSIQGQQISEALRRESAQIIGIFLSGSHQRIQDPDLQSIWKEMGWKGSVKARHFVLALRDHFADKRFALPDENDPARKSLGSSQSTHHLIPTTGWLTEADGDWALSYINVAYLQPILEAIDDDSSGFINIKEVNTFAVERPEGWTLTQWLAYWAAGWHISVIDYRKKIYRLVQDMFKILDDLHPDNRGILDEYINTWPFLHLDALLRSTRPILDDEQVHPELSNLTDKYTTSEETRLENNMKAVAYHLDTAATVTLVTGPGRIERYIYPLLYLLLKRHLLIFKIACKHVINRAEMDAATDSLFSVFSLAQERQQNIEVISKQMHLDVETQLRNIAFGMLSFVHVPYNPSAVSFLTWSDDDSDGSYESDESDELDESDEELDEELDKPTTTDPTPPLDVLRLDVEDTYHFDAGDFFLSDPEDLPSYLKGLFFGHCTDGNGNPHDGLFELRFERMDQTTLAGKARNFSGSWNLEGIVEEAEGEPSEFDIDFTITHEDEYWIQCTGTLNLDNETIVGTWDDSHSSDDTRRFFFCKTPSALFRYRYSVSAFKKNKAHARWSFACAAVLSLVRSRFMSWPALQARFAERRKFIGFNIRRVISNGNFAPSHPLLADELEEWTSLSANLDLFTSQLYEDLVMYQYYRMTFHGTTTCDACSGYVIGPRLACITCRDELLADGVDFCSGCIGRDAPETIYPHSPSHSLLRCDYRLHDASTSWLYTESRLVSTRVKAEFRDLEGNTQSDGNGKTAEVTLDIVAAHLVDADSALLCMSCGKAVTTPCWACVHCAPTTFLCLKCDTEQLPVQMDGPGSKHQRAHHLLYIPDSIEVEEPDNDQLNGLRKQISTLQEQMNEHNIEIKLGLEHKLEVLELSVEKRLVALEARVDSRLASMEGILQQLLGLLTPKA